MADIKHPEKAKDAIKQSNLHGLEKTGNTIKCREQ